MTTKRSTANDTYQARQQEAHQLLDQIRDALDAHSQRQQKDPGNWGFVGDLGSTVRDLREVFVIATEEN